MEELAGVFLPFVSRLGRLPSGNLTLCPVSRVIHMAEYLASKWKSGGKGRKKGKACSFRSGREDEIRQRRNSIKKSIKEREGGGGIFVVDFFRGRYIAGAL